MSPQRTTTENTIVYSKCGCNEFGSEDLDCDAQGKCNCKCNVCGDKCDECCIGYYGLAVQDDPKETFMDHCHGNYI